MGDILTAAAYLKALRRSELIEEAELDRLLREFRDSGVSLDDPQALANALVTRRVLTRWQNDMLMAGKHRGFFLGKYRLLSLLGQGGMGAVYLAEHRMMRRRVAIKVLPPRKSGNAEYVARFRREARAAATLDHINIVRMYDIDQDQDKDTVVHFLVLEYVDGGSLQDLVNSRGPLDPLTAANFICQAAEGLAHAHSAGIVHRDVSSANVLIDSSGTVKILDLGLAQFYRDSTATATSDVGHRYLGTADYLAPEQALDSTTVDPRTDLYALGCTFYFLLAGHPPFPGGTATQKLIAHQTCEPKPIEQERPEIPESLSLILRRMMAKKREDRWQSATELSQALQQWISEQRMAQPRTPTPSKQSAGSTTQSHSGGHRDPLGSFETHPKIDTTAARTTSLSPSSIKIEAERSTRPTARRDKPHQGNRWLILLLVGMLVILIGGYVLIYARSQSPRRPVGRLRLSAVNVNKQFSIPLVERSVLAQSMFSLEC